jgi:hypothetical protein
VPTGPGHTISAVAMRASSFCTRAEPQPAWCAPKRSSATVTNEMNGTQPATRRSYPAASAAVVGVSAEPKTVVSMTAGPTCGLGVTRP